MLKKGARMRRDGASHGPELDHARVMRAPGPPAARPEHQRRQLYFGEFSAELDASDCSGLFRGNEPVGLSDVPRKVLFLLLQERPRPVLAKSLMDALWHPGANASNVAKQVKALRVAMGDERVQAYIRTVKKEGYAFVMPVMESPASSAVAGAQRRPDGTPRVELVPGGGADDGARASPSRNGWRLATAKMVDDFRGSCLHDLERLEEAIEACHSRVRLLVSRKRLHLPSWFAQDPAFVPPRRTARLRGAPPEEPDPETRSSLAPLVAYSRASPIVVNVGAYSPACLAVLQSLRRRYGLDVRSDFENLSGRQQVLALRHDDEADFLFAPHGPVLLVGEGRALDYRWVTPIYEYEQIVFQAPGTPRGRIRKLLVYRGGSPEEQLISGVGIPRSAEPEMIGSLERLIKSVPQLSPGDMVIAWQPLASGLESRHRLRRIADFRCWISLYCHKRWQRGALRHLKSQFTQLFAREWIFAMQNLDWATECLALELRAVEFFAAGSGLDPGDRRRPDSPRRPPGLHAR
jgi:DNA-binding winged helix-turn-helix (wHTH) protein